MRGLVEKFSCLLNTKALLTVTKASSSLFEMLMF